MTDERCITGLESLPAGVRGCVLTIGNFDGVHRGHRRIVETARELARAEGTVVAALTFEPPPDLVLRPDDAPERVVPPAVKGRLLREAGCNWVVTARTDRALLSLTPEEFVGQIIIRNFAPKHVVEGPNFYFGRKRAGNVEMLARAGAEAGFDVHVAEPVQLDLPEGREVVSSTLIRRCVAAGDVQQAALCLGREFTLYGCVVAGRGIGKVLDYPTANLSYGEQICPADGVYAGRAAIAGKQYAAAISVGNQPTFPSDRPDQPIVEAFLLNASGDFYDREIALSFQARLREQRRYESIEDLKAQIAEDVEQVRGLLEGNQDREIHG